MAKELPHCLDIRGRWQLGNKLNFSLIDLNFHAGDDMPKDNSVIHQKMTFFLVKHQVFFNASTENSFKVG